MFRFRYLILALCCVALLSTCTSDRSLPFARTAKHQNADAQMQADINAKIKETLPQNTHIEIDIFEGTVLLTGSVETARQKLDAENIATNHNRTETLINKIKIREKATLKSEKENNIIAIKLKTYLLRETIVFPDNYIFRVTSEAVYILGISESEEELSIVLAYAEMLGGERKIAHFTRPYDSRERRKFLKQFQKNL